MDTFLWGLYEAVSVPLGVALHPLSALPSWPALLIFSALLGLACVWAYGKLSNQEGIRRAKRRIGASLYEAIVFRSDPVLSLKAQGKLFLGGLEYLSRALVPVLILAAPCGVILAQGYVHLGVQPFVSGDSTIVRARIEPAAVTESVAFEGKDGVDVSNSVRSQRTGEAVARIARTGGASPEVTLHGLNGGTATLLLNGLPTELVNRPSLGSFFYPTGRVSRSPERKLQELRIEYPERDLSLLGVVLSWTAWVIIFTLLIGFGFARLLRIEV